jgi:CHAD domain-containing protein
MERALPGLHAIEHEVLAQYLLDLVSELHRYDPAARADLPDAVHQLRLVVRRLRSVLRSFDPYFDTRVTDPVRHELHWVGDILGRARDLEVIRVKLAALVAEQPPELVRGRPGPWIDRRLATEHHAAHQGVREAMESGRYAALVRTLDSWPTAMPWSHRSDSTAGDSLRGVLLGERVRLDEAVARVDGTRALRRVELLHEVRKQTRRMRYAANVLEPVLDGEAQNAARTAKELGWRLGAHHDTVIAIDAVLVLTNAARTTGRGVFTLGVLRAQLETELAEHDDAFRRTWQAARRSVPPE